MDKLHGTLLLTSTLISLTTNVYCICALIKQVKKFGARSLLASLAFQILLWDFVRCITVGLVSGVTYYLLTDTGLLCTFLGPFTNMALRLPFFLAAGNVLTSLKRAEKGSCLRRTGLAIVAIGYLVSIVFSLLPFLHNTYSHGMEGFCTYYSSDVLGYDYIYSISEKQLLMYDILISVLPFLIGFLGLILCWVPALFAKKQDVTSMTSSLALMICYLPMLAVGIALIAEYFGIHCLYSLDWDTITLIQLLAMVIFPVSTPTVSLLLSTLLNCCCRGAEEKEAEHFPNRKYSSMSTSVLVHNIDGMPGEFTMSIPE